MLFIILGAVFGCLGFSFVLPALGFTATGIAAGSWAAWWMSLTAIGNGVGVAAGSVFAVLQSIGATAGLLTTAIGTVVGALGGGLILLL